MVGTVGGPEILHHKIATHLQLSGLCSDLAIILGARIWSSNIKFLYRCIDRVRLKNHVVKILQVIIPSILFTLFTYITHNNPGQLKIEQKSIVQLKIMEKSVPLIAKSQLLTTTVQSIKKINNSNFVQKGFFILHILGKVALQMF